MHWVVVVLTVVATIPLLALVLLVGEDSLVPLGSKV